MYKFENEVKENDIYYFKKAYDSKRDKDSFIGYDAYGKVIISDKVLSLSGFFKIARVKKTAEKYYIVTLGERVEADDFHPHINLEEAKKVLEKFGFETFEKEFNFNDYDEKRHEIQLFAWHKKYNIFVTGTTWTCDGYDNGHFNDLTIYAPNYLRTFNDISHGQITTCADEITIDVKLIHDDEKILTKLMNLAKENPNKKIVMKVINNGKSNFCNIHSYVSEFIGYEDSLDGWNKYKKDIYKEFPRNLKEFIVHNTRTVA